METNRLDLVNKTNQFTYSRYSKLAIFTLYIAARQTGGRGDVTIYPKNKNDFPLLLPVEATAISLKLRGEDITLVSHAIYSPIKLFQKLIFLL